MLFKQICHANARGTYFESKHVQPSSIDIIIIIIINIFNNPNLENSLLNIYLKSDLTNATASYTAKMGGGRKILPTPSLVKIHNRIKRYIWKDKQANIIFGLIVCYIDIGGGKEGKEGRGLVLLQVQFIPFGPLVRRIALLLPVQFSLSRGRSICRNDFVVLPLPPLPGGGRN